MPSASVPVMLALLLYTSKLVAGDEMVEASVVLLNDTLGISMPLLELTMSSMADSSGLLPVVLMAMFCADNVEVCSSTKNITQPKDNR